MLANVASLRELYRAYIISTKHFRLEGMAASELTRSISAVRDTPGVDYIMPGVNTPRCIAYCPPIAVSPFHLSLSLIYLQQPL